MDDFDGWFCGVGNYPLLTALFDQLQEPLAPTTKSTFLLKPAPDDLSMYSQDKTFNYASVPQNIADAMTTESLYTDYSTNTFNVTYYNTSEAFSTTYFDIYEQSTIDTYYETTTTEHNLTNKPMTFLSSSSTKSPDVYAKTTLSQALKIEARLERANASIQTNNATNNTEAYVNITEAVLMKPQILTTTENRSDFTSAINKIMLTSVASNISEMLYGGSQSNIHVTTPKIKPLHVLDVFDQGIDISGTVSKKASIEDRLTVKRPVTHKQSISTPVREKESVSSPVTVPQSILLNGQQPTRSLIVESMPVKTPKTEHKPIKTGKIENMYNTNQLSLQTQTKGASGEINPLVGPKQVTDVLDYIHRKPAVNPGRILSTDIIFNPSRKPQTAKSISFRKAKHNSHRVSVIKPRFIFPVAVQTPKSRNSINVNGRQAVHRTINTSTRKSLTRATNRRATNTKQTQNPTHFGSARNQQLISRDLQKQRKSNRIINKPIDIRNKINSGLSTVHRKPDSKIGLLRSIRPRTQTGIPSNENYKTPVNIQIRNDHPHTGISENKIINQVNQQQQSFEFKVPSRKQAKPVLSFVNLSELGLVLPN